MNLKELLCGIPGVKLGHGVDEMDVERVERTFGVRIRGGYRRFLIEVGWAYLGADGIIGLGDDTPVDLNLLDIIRSEREEMEVPLPDDLVPLLNNGGGDYYCLQATDSDCHSEPRVVLHCHDDPHGTHVIADSFDDWLEMLITELRAGAAEPG